MQYGKKCADILEKYTAPFSETETEAAGSSQRFLQHPPNYTALHM
jgi:hypothetical protein